MEHVLPTCKQNLARPGSCIDFRILDLDFVNSPERFLAVHSRQLHDDGALTTDCGVRFAVSFFVFLRLDRSACRHGAAMSKCGTHSLVGLVRQVLGIESLAVDHFLQVFGSEDSYTSDDSNS